MNTPFLYRPGRTLLHRLPAGVKLAGLLGLSVVLFAADTVALLAAGFAAAALALALAAGRAAGDTLRQLVWPALTLAALVLANAWLVDPLQGARVGLRLGALVLAALAVTLATRTSDLLAVVERLLVPLERLRLLNAQQAALALSLAITLLPLLLAQVRAAREAQLARGAPHSLRALTTPLIVRILKAADELADAIDARGFPREPGAPPPRGPGGAS